MTTYPNCHECSRQLCGSETTICTHCSLVLHFEYERSTCTVCELGEAYGDNWICSECFEQAFLASLEEDANV
jgi:hypothetical protein